MVRPRLTSDYEIVGEVAVVTLGGSGGVFIVDVDDVEAVAAMRWQGGPEYVISTLSHPRRTVRLHRWLLGIEQGDPRQVDHVDGDPRNNRRSNLRVVDAPVQAQNRKVGRNTTSGVRGVSHRSDPRRRHKPWVATLRIDGRQRTIGSYATITEAAAAVQAARATHMPYSIER